ncbi:hypothetical protein ACHAQH_006518 [Verticillium albo-atrum]
MAGAMNVKEPARAQDTQRATHNDNNTARISAPGVTTSPTPGPCPVLGVRHSHPASSTGSPCTFMYIPSHSEGDGEDDEEDQGTHHLDFDQQWALYFHEGGIHDWQRLMADLGFLGVFQSRTQCRKALLTIWICLPQFLVAERKPEDVIFFTSERALSIYATKMNMTFSKRAIASQSPLRQLLGHLRRHQRSKESRK